jgi:hypothetical protein
VKEGINVGFSLEWNFQLNQMHKAIQFFAKPKLTTNWIPINLLFKKGIQVIEPSRNISLSNKHGEEIDCFNSII